MFGVEWSIEDDQNREILHMELARLEAVRFQGSTFRCSAQLQMVWQRLQPSKQSVFQRLLLLLQPLLP